MSSRRDLMDTREAANLLNKMDNAGFERDQKSTVEMGDVGAIRVNGNGVPGCTDLCRSMHQQHQQSIIQVQKGSLPKQPESPWHRLKTIFLVTIIALLVIWILVYTILSQCGVL